jgi:histidinol phosphatase-like enzyme
MLVQAAERHAINLEKSYMVGDRLSDIQAGEAAGCQTAWVQTGRHLDAPIVSRERAASVSPDFTGANLAEATAWILR